MYWFCHTSTWIHHRCTRVPHPEPPSHLLPHPIPLVHPSAPAPSTLYHAPNLDWWFISHMIIYMFKCPSPISSHLHPLPQSPKDCSVHLCLFCSLAYRVIVTFFLNSIYLRTVQFSSVTQSCLTLCNPKHAGPPCPSPTPGVHSNSCPSSRWCHPAISSSVIFLSSCPQSDPLATSISFYFSKTILFTYVAFRFPVLKWIWM